MQQSKYYQLDDGEDEADLYIFGDIIGGDWKEEPDRGGYDIVKELQDVKAPAINVHINSYGGEVSEGLAIYNVLKNSAKTVTTYCEGFACSAASVIFMAGSKRIMREASLLMIHNAWTMASGNAADLRKAADDIDTITQASVEAYKSVAKISEDEIKSLMDAETWILPEKAVEYGFATEVDKTDDPDKPQESAFGLIRQSLIAPEQEAQKTDIPAVTIPSADEIADRVIERLGESKKHQESAWDKFFRQTKKGY